MSAKLLCIAYPDLSQNDFSFIQDIRRNNDRFFSSINPHFTLVFPVEGISQDQFSAEIKKQALECIAFSFVIRCATIHKDEFSNEWFVFLVPDEGNSRLIKLHNNLYREKLNREYRIDIDYIPHITVCNSPDRNFCKKLAGELNAKPFHISGAISTLEVVPYTAGIVTTVEKINLQLL